MKKIAFILIFIIFLNFSLIFANAINSDTFDETNALDCSATDSKSIEYQDYVVGELNDNYKLCYQYIPSPPWTEAFYVQYGRYIFVNYLCEGESGHGFYVRNDDEKLMLSEAFEKGITDIEEVVSLILSNNITGFNPGNIVNLDEAGDNWRQLFSEYNLHPEETSATTIPSAAEIETTESVTTELVTTEPTDPEETIGNVTATDSTEVNAPIESVITDSTESVTTDIAATEPTTSKDNDVSISVTSKTLKAGKTFYLKVNNTEDKPKFTCDKNKIVKVSSKGKITALTKGTAIVTVNVSGKIFKCKITVTSNPIAKIKGNDIKTTTRYNIKKGSFITVRISGKAQSIKNTYKTSNKSIAKVVSKRNTKIVKIKALKKGKATISIKVNKYKTFKINVKVK